MSENMKRIPLDEEVLEDVTGGNILYVCTATEHYCWGAHSPERRYEFQSRRKVVDFVNANYDYYGEAGIFDALIQAGLVVPMN